MKRSDITVMPEYFDRYINLVDDIDLSAAFDQSLKELDAMDVTSLAQLGDRTYAEGKWTIKDIIQHLVDTERVLSYRALRFARNDATPLPGFEEKDFAAEARPERRNLKDILSELKTFRVATKTMFDSFDEIALKRSGIASGKSISVLALGFTIAGHQRHHFNVINKSYLPLLTTND